MNIKNKLLEWYQHNKRTLPFRESNNPYHIWISEIMAQQTQIDTMLPYFTRWIIRFPEIIDVAKANEEEILKLWEGLGYYRRAKNIHETAKIIVSQFHGDFPRNYSDVRSLPGIGDYTAGAICSIAFDLPTTAIDGNVIRVISRLYGIQDNPKQKRTLHQIESKMIPFLGEINNGDLTQAWMELGALVCTPRNPKCDACPLNNYCFARINSLQNHIPPSKSKPRLKIECYDVFLNYDKSKILISSDDSDGLMTGLYRLPQKVASKQISSPVFQTKHIFSHKIWKLNVFVNQIDIHEENWFYISLEDLKSVPMITAHKKIIRKFIKK